MSLRKPPKSTPQGSAASRENGKKSQRPVSAQGKANVGLNVDSRLRGNDGTVPLDVSARGKANVSLNALQDSSYSSASARTFRDTLMALGEAPEEFDRLYQGLLAPYVPARPLGRTISSNFKLEEQA